MFSIYGISGPVFSGKLESMPRVRQAQSVSRVRPIALDGEDLSIEATTRPSPRDEAIRTYRQMLYGDLDRGPLYHAAQIMTGSVITLKSSDAVAQAWRVLREKHIYQAPVVDATGRLVGIVSERDLLTAINIDGDRIIETLQRQVSDVMTTPVVAAASVTDIRRIAAVMLEYGVAGVPIVNDAGHLAGFVSRSDILRAVVTVPPLSLWR
ncbi:MAG: CBS domain-containing protein [Betaproteobacteria bacterium]|nr:CBS domain-containing protein [Betaproteobacteria bacterium]